MEEDGEWEGGIKMIELGRQNLEWQYWGLEGGPGIKIQLIELGRQNLEW